MKNKKILIVLPVFLISIWLAKNYYQKKQSISSIEVNTYEGKENTAPSNSSAMNLQFISSDSMPLNKTLKKIKALCPKSEDKFRSAPETPISKVQLARNLHFKKNGEIFRLRTFLKDTQESTFTKLVFYKEDSAGFAVIQKIPEQDQINPSKETQMKYLGNGEVIYDEKDIRLSFKKFEINYSVINDEVVKIVAPKLNCYFDKP